MNNGSVMIIEDQYHFRKGLVKMIEDSQFNWSVVSEASNGTDALKMLELHQPDLILTDIRMPVMDGIEFVTEVRRKYPSTPIIILSGYRNFEYAQAAIKLGVIDYLVKPCTEEDIHQMLHKANRYLQERANSTISTIQNDAANYESSQQQLSTDVKQQKLIEKAIAYMNLHYKDDCRLTEVASHVKLNASYFSVLFKKITGESYTTYLTRLRLEKAIQLLRSTDMKVFEVAQAAGFDNSNYFINVFRQYHAISPKEYRNRNKLLNA